MNPLDYCWKDPLWKRLRQLPQDESRLVVMGIGHELRGDDAAGLAVARALQPYANNNFLIVEAAQAPENHTAPVRRFAPHFVLLVDAADLHAPPGTISWLEWPKTTGMASTHTMPLYLLAHYLATEANCFVGLLGIQPADTGLALPLSPQVAAAVAAVVGELSQWANKSLS